MRPHSPPLGQSRLRHLCLRLLFLLVLLFGGLGALCTEASERDSLSVERVERIGAFDAEQLERSFGLVRFRSSAQARYALDLGDESWYLSSVKMGPYYKAYLLQYAYEDLLSELGATTKGGFSFQQEHTFTDKTDWYLSRYVDKPVYATLDGASVVLGFIGLDTAPDALNLFYSVARGHTLQASLAGASLLMVGPTALTALKYADEVAQGVEITARIAKATPQPHSPRYVYYAPKTKQIYSDVVYKQPSQVGKEAKDIAEHELLRGIDPQQILEAQEVLTKAGHTRLAMQADALRIVIELRAHKNFKAFGLTDELLGKISSTVNTEGYAQIVTNLRTFVDKFDHNKVEGLDKLVSFLGDQKQSFREGAEWTLRYLANHADEFTSASKISFEVTEVLKKGRRVSDMIVETTNGPVYYEFKSVKDLPPGDFLEQFGKDLSRDNFSVDNLKWIFDGKKIQAKDLQRLRGKLDEIVTDRIAVRHGFSDANAMINELFKNVFKIH